ncbi:hypothetical protein RM844_13585 [Streptomyces sp. DSM 44915]|uniref:Uncharacterized protein n=1 Tax=Streptomyces chisholmiae TaxID=3075540 RepID=A0ABU2JQP8_9ACTN|nr:hypothetical protein [Streptomyces sp. DSM 44915]MDT0267317.1 hypothetical protein [Streptomyces sp. DSM 44915]
MSALSRLAALPAPHRIRARLRTLTLLEVCFDPKWPRYTYTPAGDDGFERFVFKNAGGASYRVYLGRSLTFLRAFDPQSPLSPYAYGDIWPGLLDGLPEPLVPLTRLPDERPYPHITLALWHDGASWKHGDPRPLDGEEAPLSRWLLGPLPDFTATAIADHLNYFYERPVDPEAVSEVIGGAPIDGALLERLAPGADLAPVQEIARVLDGRPATPSTTS